MRSQKLEVLACPGDAQLLTSGFDVLTSWAIGPREPAGQLPGRFVWCRTVERHEGRGPAAMRQAGAPSVASNGMDFDHVGSSLDSFGEHDWMQRSFQRLTR